MLELSPGSLVQHKDDLECGIVIGQMETPSPKLSGFWLIYWPSGHFGGSHFSEIKILN